MIGFGLLFLIMYIYIGYKLCDYYMTMFEKWIGINNTLFSAIGDFAIIYYLLICLIWIVFWPALFIFCVAMIVMNKTIKHVLKTYRW